MLQRPPNPHTHSHHHAERIRPQPLHPPPAARHVSKRPHAIGSHRRYLPTFGHQLEYSTSPIPDPHADRPSPCSSRLMAYFSGSSTILPVSTYHVNAPWMPVPFEKRWIDSATGGEISSSFNNGNSECRRRHRPSTIRPPTPTWHDDSTIAAMLTCARGPYSTPPPDLNSTARPPRRLTTTCHACARRDMQISRSCTST